MIIPRLASIIYKYIGPGRDRKKLSIFIYHRVLSKHDELLPYEITLPEFDWHLNLIKKHFTVLELADAIAAIKSNSLPANAACITFDDGYHDNYSNALPLLKKYNLPATFFVATKFLNGGIMWNDQVRETLRSLSAERLDLNELNLGQYDFSNSSERHQAVESVINKLKYFPFVERQNVVDELNSILNIERPRGLMMTDGEVRLMRASGMGIGGHTVSHPILSSLNAKDAENEINDNKATLESILGEKIEIFAYPNGKPGQDYTKESVSLVKRAGYIGAVSTSWGVSTSGTDVYQIPRFTPWDRSQNKYMLRLCRNVFNKPEFV